MGREDFVSDNANATAYWQANLRIVGILLSIWFIVSYGFGIFFAEALNGIKILGFPLGFWFAQNGSIYIFIALIAVYVFLMGRLDEQFGFAED